MPDLNAKNVVGVIAFEVAGRNPLVAEFGNPPAIANWTTEPVLPQDFTAVNHDGCPMQGESPSQLVNYAGIPLVLAATEYGLGTTGEGVDCQVAAWRQAGVDATGVYFPDRGLSGGGHFAMAQLDNAAYAQVFIELASDMEASATK